MKHYIKNIGSGTLTYANNITNGESYEFFDDVTNEFGVNISAFAASFYSEDGIGKDIYLSNVEYYQDTTLTAFSEFYDFWPHLQSALSERANFDTDNNYTFLDFNKLDDIENGAEMNNISDMDAYTLIGATGATGDIDSLHTHAYDRARANHIGTQLYTTISDFDAGVTANADVILNTAHRGTTSGNPHQVTKTDVGLSNVPNIDTTNASNITSGTLPSSVIPPAANITDLTDAIDENENVAANTAYRNVGHIPIAEKGTAFGVAELDGDGKLLVQHLPSYVDDVIEGYLDPDDVSMFFDDAALTILIVPAAGKIYIDLTDDMNITYRWSGSVYVEISSTLALGTTSGTASRGDHGLIAYTHATGNGSDHTLVADLETKINNAVYMWVDEPDATAMGQAAVLAQTLKFISDQGGKEVYLKDAVDALITSVNASISAINSNTIITDWITVSADTTYPDMSPAGYRIVGVIFEPLNNNAFDYIEFRSEDQIGQLVPFLGFNYLSNAELYHATAESGGICNSQAVFMSIMSSEPLIYGTAADFKVTSGNWNGVSIRFKVTYKKL